MKDGGELMLFSGTSNEPLAKIVSSYLQIPLSNMTIKQFKDGEVYCRVNENVRGRDVFLIQSTSTPVNSNLMELAIEIDALKRASAGRVTAIIPYFGYARQDRKAVSREPITAKLVANLITAAGTDRVMTIDLHADQIQGFFDIPLDHMRGLPIFVSYFKQKSLGDFIVVAPDVGGVKRARYLAQELKVPLALIDKRRAEQNKVAEVKIIGDVEYKNCILFDDMIDTGGTMCEAAKALKAKGAKSILICATHGIFSAPAVDILKEADVDEIVVTDTINPNGKKFNEKFKVLSVAPLIGEAIKAIHFNKSVSELDNRAFEVIQNRLF